ncbi:MULTISPECIES: exodeoxyribonuclease VII large subunit [unclassified Sphingobium]|uniref:exodeoxyribonuclease VII large subunit n=1 Tax=unclassified Sphingobium TaxID=2611147 RepID=UPI002225114D|nr:MULTISPECIES: exodeoxyribonuclease VII large subunit [unclassified Sphingobium]MCW2395653.1 exodeoxyribonuclease VII large subunit [Sphingobium sp. B8D3B]MCW2419168.1 exodeoxyribonuclease VII large subunit [Sphingobium sp. B8D3C]
MSDFSVSEDAFGRLLAQERAGDNLTALSISELSAQLKRTVEDRFGFVRLRGEISGFKRAASGHIYCCLKDDAAVIDGVMWKGTAGRLAFRPEDGLDVIVTGKVTTYPGRSKYQIVIESMELAGEGALMQLFEKLKARLSAEGLFDPAKRRPIPMLPDVIGVVTSPTGAVIRDILHRLADRFPSRVLLWPVLVQGEGAAAQVAAAVRGFGALPADGPIPRPDVLIVARGGGSIEDLWSFNEEVVVRAVAESPIPVISAVGHETDTTLCDFAADLRAPTPTAAAEMAVPVRADLAVQVAELRARMQRCVARGLDRNRERLEAQRRLLPRPDVLLAQARQRADDLGDRLRRGLSHRVSRARHELADASGALRPALLQSHLARERQKLANVRLSPLVLERRLGDARRQLDGLWRLAQSLNPDAPLKRGFARVMAQGRLVRSAEEARAAGRVTLKFEHDEVTAMTQPDAAGGDSPAQAFPSSAPPPSAPRPARKAAPSATSARQTDLFD